MIADPIGASQSVMEVLAGYGIAFDIIPAIKILMEKAEQHGELKKRTIVFDPAVPQFSVDSSPEFLIIALAARYAKEARIKGISNVANNVKDSITTSNGNGLGWLFGKGKELIASASAEEVKSYLGIEKENPSYAHLLELLKGVSAPDIFSRNVLSDARGAVQGVIDSTISNHMSRISASIDALENKEGVQLSMLKFFEVLGADASKSLQGLGNLPNVLPSFEAVVERGVRALRVLNGEYEGKLNDGIIKASIDDYNKAKSAINYLVSCSNILAAAIKRGDEVPGVEVPSHWNDLISLPHFSKYIPSVIEDRKQLAKDTSSQIGEFQAIMEDLVATHGLDFDKALENRKNFYSSLCAKSKKSALLNPERVGYRDLLSRLTSSIYRGSEELRKTGVELLWASGVFESKQDLREHCWQRKHYVHVSPLDTKPKKLLRLTERNVSIISLCDSLLAASNITALDRLNLELLKAGLLLIALPDFISTKAIDTKVVRECGDYRFRAVLDSMQIERSIAISLLISAYRNAVAGKIYRLSKSEFILTRSFRVSTGQKIIYSPKKSNWKVPLHLFEGRYKCILQSKCCVWDSANTLNVAATVENLVQTAEADIDIADLLAFLRDVPHRFFIAADINDWGDTAFGVKINNGKIERSGVMSGLVPIGQSRNNNKIVTLLNMIFDGGKISPPVIQFERAYRVDEKGELHESKDKRRVTVQIPASYSSEAYANKVWEPEHIIGIDPGVYGMGLCVMTLDGEVRDKGFIPISSLIGYCKKKEIHQNVTAPRQQYLAPYSDHLSKASKAAIGDITYIVDRLSNAFNALPVFEYSGGSKDPSSSVWSAVQSLYCWGENDSQNSSRKSHWKGASHWDTTLLRKQNDDAKPKLFTGYPGTRVSGYGNSYRCCKCGRNAIEDAKFLVEGATKAVIVDGKLQLPSGKVNLLMPDSNTVVERRRQNKGPIYIGVRSKVFDNLSPSSKSAADLITSIRRSVRRAPSDRNAKQGIDSHFFCPYIDCESQLNADVNSAVNIAAKCVAQLR